MTQADLGRYEDENALRRQVEKSQRPLSDDEWAQVAPDWSAPYGDQDFVAILQTVRSLPAQPKPSQEENARGYRRAHVQRAALEAREMVEDLRKQLFDRKMPPFHEDAAAATRWIEEQANPLRTMRLRLEVTVPAADAGFTPLIHLRDLLNQHLPENPPIPEDPQAFGQLLGRCDFINDISFSPPAPLAYLDWSNPQDEKGIKRVSAPDGTLLGRFREASETLARTVNWEPYAAVYHLLTGGIMSPEAVRATTQYRIGQKVFGDTHPITLEISDPESVTQQDINTAFREERKRIAPPWNGSKRQRPRKSPKSERVAAFVEERPGMKSPKLLIEWNRQNPNEQYRSDSVMRRARSRAKLAE